MISHEERLFKYWDPSDYDKHFTCTHCSRDGFTSSLLKYVNYPWMYVAVIPRGTLINHTVKLTAAAETEIARRDLDLQEGLL